MIRRDFSLIHALQPQSVSPDYFQLFIFYINYKVNMEIDNQMKKNILIGATFGAVVLPATILFLGLTPIGPVAGGIFAGF